MTLNNLVISWYQIISSFFILNYLHFCDISLFRNTELSCYFTMTSRYFVILNLVILWYWIISLFYDKNLIISWKQIISSFCDIKLTFLHNTELSCYFIVLNNLIISWYHIISSFFILNYLVFLWYLVILLFCDTELCYYLVEANHLVILSY